MSYQQVKLFLKCARWRALSSQAWCCWLSALHWSSVSWSIYLMDGTFQVQDLSTVSSDTGGTVGTADVDDGDLPLWVRSTTTSTWLSMTDRRRVWPARTAGVHTASLPTWSVDRSFLHRRTPFSHSCPESSMKKLRSQWWNCTGLVRLRMDYCKGKLDYSSIVCIVGTFHLNTGQTIISVSVLIIYENVFIFV